ncbi:MAG: PKD domain-containing protein [Cyclobacteriaceae bacterium]
MDESILVENTTPAGSFAFEWDFCSGDLVSDPVANVVLNNSNFFRARSFKLINEGEEWFGFAISATSNILMRFDFGTEINSVPLFNNLGNVGLALNMAFSFDMIKVNGTWKLFVANGGSKNISAYSFVNGIQSVPTVELLNTPLVFDNSGPNAIRIVNDGINYFGFISVGTSVATSKIVRLAFGTSLDNANPTVSEFSLPSANIIRGMSFVRECNSWIGFALSQNTNALYRLDFGTDLNINPTTSILNTSGLLNTPVNIEVRAEGGEYYAFVQNARIEAVNASIYRISFGESIVNTVVLTEKLSYPELTGGAYALDVATANSSWSAFTFNLATNNLLRFDFDNICGASLPASTERHPPLLNYSEPNQYKVALKKTDDLGNSNFKTFSILVTSSEAPDISFTSQNVCANHDINFTSQNTSGDITDHNWDFGDTNTSILANPTHQYASAGDYVVSLQVTATNGCNNLARDTITIYNQPIANFDLPNTGPAPICTNQEYLFANTSTFDPGSDPTWQWEVNGSPVSSDQDLNYSIPTATMQDVKLIASIPGCETELMQTINTVEFGPSPDFTFSNDCEDASILFTNATTGTTIGFSWDFGDGNSSLQTDPSNTFVDFGNYEVTLQATNAAGCINSVVKPIQIYSKPITDFSIDLPPFSCAGTASQFNDLTPSPTDSNLSGWAWTFGDPQNGTSTVRHAQYVYQQAGMYDVELEVTTNFGCKESIQKQVTIFQSPGVDFQFEAACVGEATQFTDLSESGVTAWQWNINGTASTLQNPTYTFPAPTVYNASLTVTGSNNCIATLFRPVNVPAPPVLDFLVENNCATQTTLFSDNSQYGSDLPSTRSWLFEGSTQALGSSAEYSFASVGTFPTQLTVTSQSGCEYTLTKNVQIVNPPVASFVASAMEGGPPLSVSLINQSLNSVSRQWTINGPENFSSTQVSPTFILNELGDYTVDLRAQNASGCSDVTSKIISVITPSLDIVLEELTLIQSGANEVSILVTLRNHSNFTTSNLAATVNAGGAALINELISATIPPGEAYTQALKTRIAGTKTTLEFVCVEIIAEGDVNPDNNKKCENLNSEIVAFNPYPNPSTSELNFDWIAATSGSAEVTIFNSNGQSVFQNSIPNFEVGLNSLSIQMPILNAGIYYIVFVSGNTRNSYPFMVQN